MENMFCYDSFHFILIQFIGRVVHSWYTFLRKDLETECLHNVILYRQVTPKQSMIKFSLKVIIIGK